MRVVVVGVGEIGKELAESLDKREGVELVLIDKDEQRCEELAGELDALVLQGDGTNPAILEKAQVRQADALVATTGSDALNTVIAMLGSRMEVGNIIVKLNDVGLRAACQEIGVSRIIAPKIAAGANILAALYGSYKLDLSTVGRGGLRLVELEISEKNQEKLLADIGMPDGALIIAVQRGDDVLLPRDKTKLQKDDIVFVLAENEKLLDQIKDLLDR